MSSFRFVDLSILACPVHKLSLEGAYFCPLCDKHFPVVNGVPILINDSNSVFETLSYFDDRAYGGSSDYVGNLTPSTGVRKAYRKLVHRLYETNPKKKFSAVDALKHVKERIRVPSVLVIGSGDTSICDEAIYTDVAFGANVQVIADAHDLPFINQTFDLCVIVAVLEHVVDPYRCVAEIERVLKMGGFVYAETPFLQPVHMGAHDFTRFTFLGHRRLFRYFLELESGIALGPYTGLAVILIEALTAMTDRIATKRLLRLLGLVATFPLRWLDLLYISKPAAYASASGFYFFGSLSESPITDRDLLSMYRGV